MHSLSLYLAKKESAREKAFSKIVKNIWFLVPLFLLLYSVKLSFIGQDIALQLILIYALVSIFRNISILVQQITHKLYQGVYENLLCTGLQIMEIVTIESLSHVYRAFINIVFSTTSLIIIACLLLKIKLGHAIVLLFLINIALLILNLLFSALVAIVAIIRNDFVQTFIFLLMILVFILIMAQTLAISVAVFVFTNLFVWLVLYKIISNARLKF